MGILEKLPVWETAFCGRTIRTGALIIAWISAMSLGISWFVYMSFYPAMFAYYGDDLIARHTGTFTLDQRAPVIYLSNPVSAQKVYNDRLKITGIGMALTYMFVVQFFLLWGILKKNHYFMLPSLLTGILLLFINLMTSFAIFIFAIINSDLLLWLSLLSLNVLCCITMYSLMIIISHYRKLRDENNRKNNSKNAEPSSSSLNINELV